VSSLNVDAVPLSQRVIARRVIIGLFLAIPLTLWVLAAGASGLPKFSEAGNPIISLRLNQVLVQAEVVSTREKMYLGLSGRRYLAPNTGMLFAMPFPAVQHFCMRDMLIPIDIIWIAQGRIIGFHPNLSPDDPGTFTSPGPVDLVLEVPAGFVAASGLQSGHQVTIIPTSPGPGR